MTGKAEFRTRLEENDIAKGQKECYGLIRARKYQTRHQSGQESVSSTVSINI